MECRKNINNVLTISDRKSAIKTACTLANDGDILVAKGTREYQEVDGQKIPFDDAQEIQTNFKILQD